jgi:uncharacterized protein YaaQ
MKMIVAIVQEQDANEVTRSLRQGNVAHTSLKTRGGFLQRGSVMIMAGVDEDAIDSVIALISRHCHRREIMHKPDLGALHPDAYASPTTISVGGAVIFILDVDQFRKI